MANARASLTGSVVDHMVTFLSRLYPNISHGELEARVRNICRDRYKPKTLIHVNQVRYGENEIVAEDLVTFFERQRDRIMTPNGCVYKSTDEQVGIVPKLVTAKLKERSVHKKAQLKAKAEGNTAIEMQHYYSQTTIKINVNSLPGGMGSKFNVFYDKGNYNSITSLGRSMIGVAYTTGEQVLGGNFAWFSEEELINHITIHLTAGIECDKIKVMMQKFNLHHANRAELMEFYRTTITQYKPGISLNRVEQLVSTLSQEETDFFWYFQNLRHLMWGNEQVFRPWINRLFDLTQIEILEHADPKELFKIDNDLISIIAMAFHDLFSVEHIGKDGESKKLQSYDLPTARPDLAIKFVSIAKHMQRMMDELQELAGIFIHTKLNVPKIDNKKFTSRNTVVLSDTDSVIFTTKDWVEWFTGDYFKLTTETYKIAGCAVYWLTKAVAHALKKFSIAHGAVGEYISYLEMKNEFMYPTMIIFGIKKTYAGQYKVQEGVVLDKLTTDIKGVQLRGSDVCKTSNQFIEDFLVKDILEKATGRLSAADLISSVVTFEHRIRESILRGETEFFKVLSIRMEKDYAVPLSSNYFYLMAWQEIFAPKYGDVLPPTKASVAFLHPATEQYYALLESMDYKIAKRARAFLEKYKKHPASICINPMLEKVPEELIPLIDVRSVIYHNTKALYIILHQLGISLKGDNKTDDLKLLFSDLYGPPSTVV